MPRTYLVAITTLSVALFCSLGCEKSSLDEGESAMYERCTELESVTMAKTATEKKMLSLIACKQICESKEIEERNPMFNALACSELGSRSPDAAKRLKYLKEACDLGVIRDCETLKRITKRK